MSVAVSVRGRITPYAPLAPLVWFKSGGVAETLFEPADQDDLIAFLHDTDPAIPLESPAALAALVKEEAKAGDIVVLCGAGDITSWSYALPGQLEALGA